MKFIMHQITQTSNNIFQVFNNYNCLNVSFIDSLDKLSDFHSCMLNCGSREVQFCGSREVQFYSIPQTRIPRPLPSLRNGMRDAGCGMRRSASRIPHTLIFLSIVSLSVTEEVSLEIRYRVVKRAATIATGPRPQKLAADRDS